MDLRTQVGRVLNQIMNPQPGERKIIQKLLAALLRAERQRFPDAHETLEAPNEKGVYIIYSPQGKVMHVGSTPRAKRRIAQRLRDHLAGRSSFTAKMFNRDGSRLRNGYQYRCLPVKDDRHRALLEALAIGQLCPKHIGSGRRRSRG
jgi:hypothetical protein